MTALSGNQMHVFVPKTIMRPLQLLHLTLLCAWPVHLDPQLMEQQM